MFYLAGVITARLCAGAAVLADAPPVGAQDKLNAFHEVTGGHYQVLAQSGQTAAFEVNRYMNLMLGQYSKFFRNWSQKHPARVVVFEKPSHFGEYAQHVAGLSHHNLAGFCHRRTDTDGVQYFELVACQNRDLYPVLAHEGFHQFIYYELGNITPIWLNEGMAQYFETAEVVNQKLRVGRVSRKKLLQAQSILGSVHRLSIEQLISMDKPTFYRQASRTYPLAWALTHYLMEQDPRRYPNGAVQKYIRDLQRGRDPVACFWTRFGRDREKLNRLFATYVMRLQP